MASGAGGWYETHYIWKYTQIKFLNENVIKKKILSSIISLKIVKFKVIQLKNGLQVYWYTVEKQSEFTV